MRYLFNNLYPIILLGFLLTISISGLAQRKEVRIANEVITAGLMKENLDYLASDSLMGRDTPSPGLDTAGAYIVRQFKLAGLKPLNGDFYQELAYCYIDIGPENLLSVSASGKKQDFKIKGDFIPYDITGEGSVEVPVVFAGYGITAPEYGYDDYKGIDVKGKIVLVLRQEPGQTDSTIKEFKGKESTRYSNLKEKMNLAKDHGAIGILVISGPLNYTSLKPRGFSWPCLSRILPKDALPLVSCKDIGERLPMVHVGESLIETFFGSADSLKKIQQGIEETMKPNSFLIPGRVVSLSISLLIKPLGGRNVVGFLEGDDPVLKNEALVIGAHYDHSGFIREHKADTDYIYNGADDNASGTCGVLAVAKAFGAMDKKPKRSVLFIAFAGEEKGLLGSATYVKYPLFPLENTVAMINLDMISRNHPDSLEIVGAGQNPELIKIIRKQNKKIKMILFENRNEYWTGGSDYYNFSRKNIPDVFFFTGLHKDYHQVSDNPDKSDPMKSARISRLVFLSAWYIANDKHRYKLVKKEKPEVE